MLSARNVTVGRVGHRRSEIDPTFIYIPVGVLHDYLHSTPGF
jgi:hypothetical protein